MAENVQSHTGHQLGENIIICENVCKWFGNFQVLKDITVSIRRQEVVVIIGPSGSGKSTFIRTINRLEEHQRGTIIVDGIEMSNDIRNIAAIRREIGMVFQQFNLFPHLTVMQNITLAPMWVRRWSRERAEAKARELLERVGIPEQADKYPGQLSGGQQQRVAIARALVNDPQVILADEPTGNLDTASSNEIIEMLLDLHRAGRTVLIVTHDLRMRGLSTNTVYLLDGKLVDEDSYMELSTLTMGRGTVTS